MITDVIFRNYSSIPQDAFVMTNPEIDQTRYSTQESYPENNFVSEIKMLLCLNTDFRNNDFQIHFDKYKRIHGRIENPILNKQYNSLSFQQGIRPDLIIHKSQDDTNPENQVFSMECKVDPNLNYQDFKKDFFKLMIYKEVLKYRENLYLIANKRTEVIQMYIDRYKSENMYIADFGIKILNLGRFNSTPEIVFSI